MTNCSGSKENPIQLMVCHLSGWFPVNIAGTGTSHNAKVPGGGLPYETDGDARRKF